MKNFIFTAFILILFSLLIPSGPVGAEPLEGRPLIAVPAENPTPVGNRTGIGEDAIEADLDSLPVPDHLPVVSEGLRAMMAKMDPTETIRVIIWLKYHPQGVISKEVSESHAAEMKEIRQRIRAINNRYARHRKLDTPRDADNYLDPDLILSGEDKNALRAVSEDHEALSLVVRDEIAVRLREEMEADQESVRTALEKLGGKVEFGTVCVNVLVAVLPVSAIDDAAAIEKVAEIREDKSHQQFLDNADNATRVTDMGSLWDAGETGGLYDPAVLDTGTDLTHPGLMDQAGRSNFYSWYLVAATNDPDFDDVINEDDVYGHGTHVMGIVAKKATDLYPSHRGMAHGVEKAVTLKAGYRIAPDEANMMETDAMYLVDRAIYDPHEMIPQDSFLDDIEGFNLSFGAPTWNDETGYSRFYDSIVSWVTDTVVTIAAGNDGPDNTWFTDPACAYNPITVANVDDQNTATRTDDVIWSTSSRGPTASGRKKPDISAPGRRISSCNNNHETQLNCINMTGTSMAAPMVLGVAMDLMDAGVTDELELKALLINTAQKNDGVIDFEDDYDGWDPAYGWGYMNALAAYHHRTDLFFDTVTPRPDSGHFHLYRGQMRDEGSSGEGRDRATMAWNRYVPFNRLGYPWESYDISNLDLLLYLEADGTLIDYDVDSDDNVAQVRVDAGAGTTDVIITAMAYDTSFDHPEATEEFALATEEGFVEVDLPSDFPAGASWPAELEPNEEADFTFQVRNDGEIPSHHNGFALQLPPGWTLVSGDEQFSAGTINGGGTYSDTVTWRLRAQPTPEDGVLVGVDHSHYSYYIPWGPIHWHLGVDVRWDTTPPAPAPGWVTPPTATSTNSITMSCTESSDEHAPVSYYFDYYYSLTGGAGGTDSGWTSNRFHIDGGLAVNHCYGYRVQARDSAQTPNPTGYNDVYYTYTLANQAGQPTVTNPTDHTLDVTIDPNGNPYFTHCAIYIDSWGGSVDEYYLNASGGSNGSTPFFQSIADWGTVTATGLDAGITYGFSVRSRNGDNIETPWSTFGLGTTTSTPDDTVGALLTCIPSSGTVPFTTQMTMTLQNLYTEQIRRVAGRLNVTLAGGAYFANWRGGYTNLDAGDSYVSSWNTTIPALGSVIGSNLFQLVAVDVTPNPYNQPPYPAAGDSDTSSCTVVANSP